MATTDELIAALGELQQVPQALLARRLCDVLVVADAASQGGGGTPGGVAAALTRLIVTGEVPPLAVAAVVVDVDVQDERGLSRAAVCVDGLSSLLAWRAALPDLSEPKWLGRQWETYRGGGHEVGAYGSEMLLAGGVLQVWYARDTREHDTEPAPAQGGS
jgi:hypothetical protein